MTREREVVECASVDACVKACACAGVRRQVWVGERMPVGEGEGVSRCNSKGIKDVWSTSLGPKGCCFRSSFGSIPLEDMRADVYTLVRARVYESVSGLVQRAYEWACAGKWAGVCAHASVWGAIFGWLSVYAHACERGCKCEGVGACEYVDSGVGVGSEFVGARACEFVCEGECACAGAGAKACAGVCACAGRWRGVWLCKRMGMGKCAGVHRCNLEENTDEWSTSFGKYKGVEHQLRGKYRGVEHQLRSSPLNRNQVNRNHLDICHPVPQKNRNSLTWVLVVDSVFYLPCTV